MIGMSIQRFVDVSVDFGSRLLIVLALLGVWPAGVPAKAQSPRGGPPGMRPEGVTIIARYFRVRISGQIFQLVEVARGPERHKAVIDMYGNFVADRGVLEKVFFVSQISGAFPEGSPRNLRFSTFLQSRVWQWKQRFQQAQALIPAMEIAGFWAFDAGPRTLAEAVKLALTGGASSAQLSAGIAKEAAISALRGMSQNPRPFLVASIHSMLGESIAELERLERMVMEANASEVLEYERIVELDGLYWRVVPLGTGGVRMYQELSGDLASNLLRGLANGTHQFIQAVSRGYGERVTTSFLGGEFQKVEQVARVQQVFAEERDKFSRWRQEDRRLPFVTGEIDNAVRIAAQMR